jgi:virginiamycin A acetyltransferase
MIASYSQNPYTVKQLSVISVDYDNVKQFPMVVIDLDSYIVSCEIQSSINLDKEKIAHNLQIGKFCSMADKIRFLLSVNHDYKHVTTGACSFCADIAIPNMIEQKNQVIVQNDVWVGSGATIMGGVTLHNGAVVAADAHVIKDVPAYAIVGGNPAKILKYRFTEEQIKKLLKISWWNWDINKLTTNKEFFAKSIDEFIDRFYEESLIENVIEIDYKKSKPVCLFYPDLCENFSITEHVIKSYCERYNDSKEVVLFMYLKDDSNAEIIGNQIRIIERLLKKYNCENNDNIVLHIDNLPNEKPLFKIADYYITTRAKETVLRTCYADAFGVKVLSGVDRPIFRNM